MYSGKVIYWMTPEDVYSVVVHRSRSVGLDSEKRVFSEKMRKEGKRWEKEAIRYRKSAYDVIKINYFIVIRIWQIMIKLNFCDKENDGEKRKN